MNITPRGLSLSLALLLLAWLGVAGAVGPLDASLPPDGGTADRGPSLIEPPAKALPLEAGLDDLYGKIHGLVLGEAREMEVDQLFTIPLDSLEAVQGRVVSLEEEVEQIKISMTRLSQRLEAPESEIPPPEPPAQLLNPPVEPLAPEPPAVVAYPSSPASQDGGIRGDGGALVQGGPDRMVPPSPEVASDGQGEPVAPKALPDGGAMVLDGGTPLPLQSTAGPREEELAARRAYEVALEKYAMDLKAYEVDQASYLAAQISHEEALKGHQARMAELREQIGRDLASTKLRLQIAQDRQTYLRAVAHLLDSMAEPAREALTSMAAPRTALRQQGEALISLAVAVERLIRRLSVLTNRVEAGALVGFLAERQALQENLRNQMLLLSEALSGLAILIRDLEDLASQIEREGTSLRRRVLVAVLSPRRQAIVDQLFLDHLKEMRRLSSFPGQTGTSPLTPRQLLAPLEQVLQRPKHIGTISVGEREISLLRARMEELDGLLIYTRLDLDRWRLAHERELVTIFSSLASRKTRGMAYSLSSEVLSDLGNEARMVWQELISYKQRRWADLSLLASQPERGALWLLRLILSLTLIMAVILLRPRMGRLVSLIVRKLNSLDFFKEHIGILVRWAGLAQAVLPILLLMVGGHLALRILGFDHPEVRFLDVPFTWITLYLLGRQILLGLTRQVSRGRPALISVTTSTVSLLRLTYGRLGLMVSMVEIIDEWSLMWLGTGSLSSLVRSLTWLWLVGWGLWAAFGWRTVLARAWMDRGHEGSLGWRLASMMANHRLGALFSPYALLRLLLGVMLSLIRSLLAEGGIVRYLRAKSLRRLARRAGEGSGRQLEELPERYIKEFPLYPILGDEGGVLLPRESLLRPALEQLTRWRSERRDASLILVGEKGIGKTTLLALLARKIRSLPVIQHTFAHKIITEEELLANLAPRLGLEGVPSMDALAEELNRGEERMVLIDESHNLFLRKVGGYQAFEALARLITHTSERIFWVLVFNTFSWEFLNRSHKGVHYFRKIIYLPPWSIEDLQDLIVKRNKRSGLRMEFDEVLFAGDRGAREEFELVETADGYFRLLWEASHGNPRIATFLWLGSLTAVAADTLKVGIFREPPLEALTTMNGDLLFTLAAVSQHENLSVDELRQTLNVHADFARYAVRFLTEYGFFEAKHTDHQRVTLSPRYYMQVLRLLRANHLLFIKE